MISEETQREWDLWERRNPGVAHPDRVRYRNNRGREKAQQEWDRGTDRFRHDEDTMSFGQRARLQRQRNGGM